MMELIVQTLESTPLLALFLAVGVGYAIGQINVGGLSLGVGGVLFSALAIGAMAPKSVPPGMVGTIGLILFLYGIGIQFGPQFLAGLRGPARRYNLLALAGVTGALAATGAGIFAGFMTSTVALQAAIDASGSRDPAVGYSVAYPFGVLGPILCFFLMQRFLRPAVPVTPSGLVFTDVTLEPGARSGGTIAELTGQLPAGVQVISVRHDHHSHVAHDEMLVLTGDALALSGSPAALDEARTLIGRATPGRVLGDRSEFDYIRVFVTTVPQTGPLLLLVGHCLMHIPFDDLLGVAAGATGNPAIPAFGTRLVQTEQVSVGYAMIFPSITILKVLLAQIAISVLGAG